jgi:hypothetical protein
MEEQPLKEIFTQGLNTVKDGFEKLRAKIDGPVDAEGFAEGKLEQLREQLRVLEEKISTLETQINALPASVDEMEDFSQLAAIKLGLSQILTIAKDQLEELFPGGTMSEKGVSNSDSGLDTLLNSLKSEALEEHQSSMVLPSKEESDANDDARLDKIGEKFSDPSKHIMQDFMDKQTEMWNMLRQGDFEYAEKMLAVLKKSQWYAKLEERNKSHGSLGWDAYFANWKRVYEKSGNEGLKKFLELEDSLKLKEITDMLERRENGDTPLDPTLN